jgi:hypothetical protein
MSILWILLGGAAALTVAILSLAVYASAMIARPPTERKFRVTMLSDDGPASSRQVSPPHSSSHRMVIRETRAPS